MNQTPSLDTVTPDQLAAVTGGGIGTQIGSMFGEKGAKWGGIADSIIGMVGGAGGAGAAGGSGGAGSAGGGGGLGKILGGLLGGAGKGGAPQGGAPGGA